MSTIIVSIRLPLNHDDFVRFLPEMQRSGMQCSFPAAAGSPPDRRWYNETAVVPMFTIMF